MTQLPLLLIVGRDFTGRDKTRDFHYGINGSWNDIHGVCTTKQPEDVGTPC